MSDSRLRRIVNTYSAFCDSFEKYLILATVIAFGSGIYAARFSPEFSFHMHAAISILIDGYDVIAPAMIFLILSPSLTRMFLTRRESRFGRYVLKWFLARKVMACLWAILFTVLVFRFPFMPERTPSFLQAFQQSLHSIGYMALESSYFWAMYCAVAVAYISARVESLFRILDRSLEGLESAARYFLPLIPLFMVAIGAYIYGLPVHLDSQIQLERETTVSLHTLHILGLSLNPNKPAEMVYIYVYGALLTGMACIIWHTSLVYHAKQRVNAFNLKDYFFGYWLKIYPLLWSTSSESISTPLNLYLTRKHAYWIESSVRRFVIGIGSYMNVNGTLICIYVLGGVVLRLLDINVSLVELLLTIPVVVLISYGVPGIPGELVMFAGPLATLLNLPPDMYHAFLAIYLGIQIGLPDSFRTGNNSTDDFLCSIIIDDIYKEKFNGEIINRTSDIDQHADQ